MFNIGPGELVAILAVALIVLGPNRLPEAVRTVGRVVGELRRISSGFQDELRNAFDDSDVIDQLEKGPSAKPAETKPTSDAIDTAAVGLSGVTASTEPVDGSEDSGDDLDGDGTDGTDGANDMDGSDGSDTTFGTDGVHTADRSTDADAGLPGTEEPPETDQRAAS